MNVPNPPAGVNRRLEAKPPLWIIKFERDLLA
jgi:hypothetical protein